MKRIHFVGIVLLLCVSLTATGCLHGRYARPYSFGTPYSGGCTACGETAPYEGIAECTDCGNVGCGTVDYGVRPPYRHRCGSCLARLGEGIADIGEGAVCIITSPFIIAKKLLCGGICGYETYPGCGCGSEVYYGDYGYGDYGCNPCGSAVSSGCTSCGGVHNGIQYNNRIQYDNAQPVEDSVRETSFVKPQPTRVVRQTSFQETRPQHLSVPPKPPIVR
jgi:hypothetical protein